MLLVILQKCGLLAYSFGPVADALPSDKDRIEHFLVAHMGLTDNRKWHEKVKLRKRQVQQLFETILEKNRTFQQQQLKQQEQLKKVRNKKKNSAGRS